MAIDIEFETLITLSEASRRLPNHPSVTTLWRWWQRGVKGHKLETAQIGGKRYTSVEALQRFVDRLSASEEAPAKPALSQKQAERQRKSRLKNAEQRLAAAGIPVAPRKSAAASV